MLQLATLASGSSGNAVLVYNQDTCLLFDAGISAKRITDGLKALGVPTLAGICITHSHSDHISGLRVLLKRVQCPVYATEATAEALIAQVPGVQERLHILYPQSPVSFGDLTVLPFSTSHDAPGSVGYTVTDGVRKCCLVTDLGCVTEEVRQSVLGAQLALVEANHDVDWLLTGPYPPLLKERVLGNGGHLSNEASGALCCELVRHGATHLVLAHLSRENNTPERARTVVRQMLALQGLDGVDITVASPSEYGAPIEV